MEDRVRRPGLLAREELQIRASYVAIEPANDARLACFPLRPQAVAESTDLVAVLGEGTRQVTADESARSGNPD